jgi:hypothetical protein
LIIELLVYLRYSILQPANIGTPLEIWRTNRVILS